MHRGSIQPMTTLPCCIALLILSVRECEDEDTGGSETITNFFQGMARVGSIEVVTLSLTPRNGNIDAAVLQQLLISYLYTVSAVNC
jgi:hypothetical protein